MGNRIRPTKSEIIEAGINVVDVAVPLDRRGKAGLFDLISGFEALKLVPHSSRPFSGKTCASNS